MSLAVLSVFVTARCESHSMFGRVFVVVICCGDDSCNDLSISLFSSRGVRCLFMFFCNYLERFSILWRRWLPLQCAQIQGLFFCRLVSSLSSPVLHEVDASSQHLGKKEFGGACVYGLFGVVSQSRRVCA